MRAYGSSLGSWGLLEQQVGTTGKHGLAFPLAVIQAIGAPHGLTIDAEELCLFDNHDAVMITVLDSRCMIEAGKHFAEWGIPLRRRDRDGSVLVWAGGQGLHNPCPFAEIADVILVGDAEDSLPLMLELWNTHGNTDEFLKEVASVPGVWCPKFGEYPVTQQVSSDVGVSLRNNISVSLDGMRRIEIARGCKSACAFCSLGWRAPLRENPVDEILQEVEVSGRRVHLQAGDAESHSGIAQIREGLTRLSVMDQGWTGRLDSFFEHPDVGEVSGQKRYAFGVEALSHRIRRAIGKPKLTDDYLVDATVAYLSRVDEKSVGRACWHVIAGLPTETLSDVQSFGKVLQRINDKLHVKRNLEIHWQPFQPLPGTPMQWCAAGGGARKLAARLKSWEHMPFLRMRSFPGRGDEMAIMCSILARSDKRGVGVIEAYRDGVLTTALARAITGTSEHELDPSDPLPWDFVQHSYSRHILERAHSVMMRRLK